MLGNDSIPSILFLVVALLFSVSLHEAAHAAAAYLLGDDTALRMGRVTLNPIAHISIFGTIIFPIISIVMGFLSGGIPPYLFGWAKPVVFDTKLLTNKIKKKTSTAIIALAGPLSNIIACLTFATVFTIVAEIEALYAFKNDQTTISSSTEHFMIFGISKAMVYTSVVLATFNLIPLGQLDGAGIVGILIPDKLQQKYNTFRYSRFSMISPMIIIYFVPQILNVIGYKTLAFIDHIHHPIAYFIMEFQTIVQV